MKITRNYLMLSDGSTDVSRLLIQEGRNEQEAAQTIQVTGFNRLSTSKHQSFSDFVMTGLRSLNDESDVIFGGVDAVIVVSQTFDTRIPSISTKIQAALNLAETTFCIDVMDGCAGFIKAISVAQMLEGQGRKKVLVVAGDINSTITLKAETGTRILFGDGVSVCILEADTSPIRVQILNEGDERGAISCSAAENVMNMNGFEVFRFTRNKVPGLVEAHFNEMGTTTSDYDLIALHQASRLVVNSLAERLQIGDPRKGDFRCSEIGNLGAGSIGAWLAQVDNLVGAGDKRMLAVGYGSGLSWGLADLWVNLIENRVVYVES